MAEIAEKTKWSAFGIFRPRMGLELRFESRKVDIKKMMETFDSPTLVYQAVYEHEVLCYCTEKA